MSAFTFNGQTVVAPAILVKSIIGANTALSLLPFGTLMFAGCSDGGHGGGTTYTFNDLPTAQKVLRSGALLDAITTALDLGGASGLIACVLGTKVAATHEISVSSTVHCTVTAGDQGAWTNNITLGFIAGTTMGTFAAVVTYPDQNGNTVVIGGLGSDLDNLTDYDSFQAAVLANNILTPAVATNLIPIIVVTVQVNSAIIAADPVNLSGGSGTGTATPVLGDVQTGLDNLAETAFDIGHLVGVYDEPSQAYADGTSEQHETLGFLRRFIHQTIPEGVSGSNSKQTNSAAVASGGVARANALSYYRSNVCAQKLYTFNPRTGAYNFVDGAIVACGLACIVGATDQWGPSSPLTRVSIPTVADVDYPVLRTTGDMDTAVGQGVMIFERIGNPTRGAVRMVQSVTTQPNNPQTGTPWILGEFSGVRGADALLANVKGAIEAAQPRAIGGGNTVGTMNSILATTVTILERAQDAGWITGYLKSSLSIQTTGPDGEDDLLFYSASITPPLNHLGITQTLLPYEQTVTLGGTVSGN